ncbi:hypothetical protein [Streptomyces sp. 351MFTsu5.1]|uniref:hypothetical protein n=1 Tax=Streptomyces sp. 351MFTsu5.1 TaxID=1172180 RepID=UPI000375E05A|nr:hypothetical protein [Streptomyces sp. 351MFTsu5.1]
MTQSGQGEQPSAREAREGIVLPSDGGEPLLPGQTGAYGAPQPGYGAPPQSSGYGGPPHGGYGNPPQADPSGQASDGAYGGSSAGTAYGQPPGAQAWGSPWGPDQQAQTQPPAQDWSQPTTQTWNAPHQPAGTSQQPGGTPSQPLPQQQPAPGYDSDEPTSYYLPPVGRPLPSAPAAPSQPLPPQQGQVAPYEAPGTAPQQQAAPGYNTDEPTSYYLPPVGRPLPSSSGPTAHEGATQFIPPVRPGALPPEAGQHPQAAYGAQPGYGPDAQATQYIPPVPGQATGGDRQPPSDFDNLFRGHGTDGGASSTQQLPRIDGQQAVPAAYGGPQPSYGAPQPPYVPPGGDGYDDGGRGGRGRSRVPVLAAVGVGIVVLGIGAGALLAGGGGGGGGGDKNQTVSATAPASGGSSAPAADAAKAQAVELDKLLADSGNSRSSVINAVANVKSCKDLGQAAQDLRAAAGQRTGLVTRLKGLAVDQLPSHAELTEALTNAWRASASADNHYAAWADQAAGRKGCKKGQARVTRETAAGNRDSGTASTEKARAARLWNAIAKKYSLTERSSTQL